MPKAFRRDVVAVARKGESAFVQIAKGFGISPENGTRGLARRVQLVRCDVRC